MAQAYVEAAEGGADGPGQELGGEGGGVGCGGLVAVVFFAVILGCGGAVAVRRLGGAEALGDGAAVGLVDAVEVEAALVDLGLDGGEFVVDGADVVGPGGGASGEVGRGPGGAPAG